MSYATTQIYSCMCRMQLNFSCVRQLQNPKFLIVYEAQKIFWKHHQGCAGGILQWMLLPK
jgi:hypothetical protein